MLIYPNGLIPEWLIDIDRWPYPVGQRDLLYELMKISEISAAFGRALQGAFTSEFQVTTQSGGYWVSVFPMGKPVTMVKIVGIPIDKFKVESQRDLFEQEKFAKGAETNSQRRSMTCT